MKLRISEDLVLGADFITGTQAILATKGKGKSHIGQVEAEELLGARQVMVAIDPTDAWWGLRSSADGKSAGYPIAVFGGDHGDIQLEPDAGAALAEAVVAERFSCVICTEGLSESGEIRFVADFLRTLYRKNREPIHLFVDECDMFAPQKPFGVDEAKALGAMQNIVRRGRNKGIGVTMISQRPSVVNKDVLSQIDMLVVLGMSHPLDLAAVEKWVRRKKTAAVTDEMMDTLPEAQIGDAWAWSPTTGLHKKFRARAKYTFDSGATPKPGKRAREAKILAAVDLERLGAAIAATVVRQKENDPQHLKAEIAKLKRANAELSAGAERAIKAGLEREPAKPAKIVTKPILKDAQIKRIEGAITKLDNLNADCSEAAKRAGDSLRALLDRFDGQANVVRELAAGIRHDLQAALTPPSATNAFAWPISPQVRAAMVRNGSPQTGRSTVQRAPVAEKPRDSAAGAGYERRVTGMTAGETAPLSKCERAMLVALAQHPRGLTRKQVLVFTGYRHSGTTTKAFAYLIAEDHIGAARGGILTITERGRLTLGDYELLPVGDALRASLLNGSSDLSTMEKAILSRVSDVYPNVLDRTTARGEYAHSGSTTNAFARLIALNYLTKSRGGVRAADELFG